MQESETHSERKLQKAHSHSLATGSSGIQTSAGPMGKPASEILVNLSNSGAFLSRRPDAGSQVLSNQIQVSRSKAGSPTCRTAYSPASRVRRSPPTELSR